MFSESRKENDAKITYKFDAILRLLRRTVIYLQLP